MADRKSGPVKPPVIDLTARDATRDAANGDKTLAEGRPAAKPSAKSKPSPTPAPRVESPAASETQSEGPAAAKAEPAATERPAEPAKPTAQPPIPPPPPRPQARLAMPWSAISIAAVGGALLGTGLTYLLATWIALPSSAPVIADPAPELAAHAERLSGLEERFALAEEASRDTQVSLDATITQLDTGFAELRSSLAEVRAAIPSPTTVDLSGIEADLRTLESRLDAMGAGASPADAGALAQDLVAIEQNLAALTGRISEIDQQLAATDAVIDNLTTELDAAKAAIATQNLSVAGADIGPAVRLPLLVSGLESALAAGRPYADQLQGLTSILPNLEVPAAISDAAQTGLSRPDDLARRFEAAVPDILAGRTGASSGDWSSDALEWAKALLALRPAEEMEGDTPEAVLSRLEGAMRRRDFVAAAALLRQLPEPMRAAAGSLATEVEAYAEAETFVAQLRTQALAPASEATP